MVYEAIILAAGLGERFYKETKKYKLLIDIHGYRLIEYPLNSLIHAGIRKFVIVVNNKYYESIKNLLSKYKVDINYVINHRISKGNGYSLLLGIPYIESKYFIVSMADHIYPPSIVKELLEKFHGRPCLGGDADPKYIELEEATLINVEDSIVVDIGKRLNNYKYVDMGVHILSKDMPYDQCISAKIELSSLIKCLLNKTRIYLADISGKPWTDVDTYNDYLSVIHGPWKVVVEKVIKEWSLIKSSR
ncbi:MAG: hypothetical protein DRO40_02170 [Thermoprotei archaeon]|nr:MAG: hypothetical protein DRO40_02170 [Thermoprotei archaeon]